MPDLFSISFCSTNDQLMLLTDEQATHAIHNTPHPFDIYISQPPFFYKPFVGINSMLQIFVKCNVYAILIVSGYADSFPVRNLCIIS